MDNLIQFIINNWYLCLAFIIVLALLIRHETSTTIAGVPFLSVQEIVAKINHAHAAIIDIRNIAAYDEGHILGAVSMPQDKIKDNMKKLQRYRTKPLIVTCQNGQQSSQVVSILRKEGFKELFGLKGGINAWREAGLPLMKADKSA